MSVITKRHFWQSTAVRRVFEIFGLLIGTFIINTEGKREGLIRKVGGRLYFLETFYGGRGGGGGENF